MAYPMLARPVVIDADNNNFDLDDGGGAVTKTLTAGTYPHVGAVFKEFVTQCAAEAITVTGSWGTDGKLDLTFSPSAAFTNMDAGFRNLFGILTTSMSGTSHSCSLTPQHVWYPAKVFADQANWEHDIKRYYKGEEALSGMGAGLTTGDPVSRLERKFYFVAGEKLSNTLCTSTYEQDRCLETFIRESRTVWGAVGQPSPAGFYYFPDHTDCSLTTASASWDDGSADDLTLTVSPSTYVFCEFDEGFTPKSLYSIRGTRENVFNITIPMHTSYAAGGSSWTGA